MASQPLNAGIQRTGHVAIDFGSTGTRAYAVVKQTSQAGNKGENLNVGLNISDSRADDAMDKRFDEGEFPSVGCPFDRPSIIIGYDAANQIAKRVVSLKSLVYFLGDLDDDHSFTEALREHYQSLPSPQEQARFRSHLDNMLRQFFSEVVQNALNKVEKESSEIRDITLCIPNTWSARENNIQSYLSSLLDKAVQVTGRKVETSFTFEAAALAQYLLRCHPEQLLGHNYLMVLDFGGHSLGGWYGQLRWKPGGCASFYSATKSDFGVRGGYEIWEIEIGKAIDEQMTRNERARKRYPEEHRHTIRAAFLDEFFRKKAHLPLDRPKCLKIDLESIRGSFSIRLPAQVLKDAWEKAYRDVLELAKEQIKLLAGQAHLDGIFILLSGGSISNLKAREELVDYCNNFQWSRSHGPAEENMKNITIERMKDLQTEAVKWTLPKGAAMALAATLDVQELFDKGAALGIQCSTWKGNWTPHTSDGAKMLYYREIGVDKPFSVPIVLRQGKVIRLIADPDFVNPQRNPRQSKPVLAHNSYDIWELSFEYEPTPGARPLSRTPDGCYMIKASEMKYNGRDAVLTLSLHPVDTPSTLIRRAKTQAQNDAPLHKGTVLYFEVPLMSNGANNLVELDLDRIKGRYWKRKAGAPAVAPAAAPAAPLRRSKRRRAVVDTDSEREDNEDGDGDGEGY